VYANLEVLKKAFSTNGLVAYKIENLVKDLEDLVNQYLSELSDGRFGLEFVITNDKLNVVISDEGRDIDILALSSGELARVNTSTLLAIRKLMSTLSKSKINVLFLDEVIGVLDDEGREKLIEVLLKEHDLNTFLVSHGWSHPLLTKISVVKQDKTSRLEK
jgi:DNA repair exonuclease SbcCD ATPase subunit